MGGLKHVPKLTSKRPGKRRGTSGKRKTLQQGYVSIKKQGGKKSRGERRLDARKKPRTVAGTTGHNMFNGLGGNWPTHEEPLKKKPWLQRTYEDASSGNRKEGGRCKTDKSSTTLCLRGRTENGFSLQ